jgi:hypothetical protein
MCLSVVTAAVSASQFPLYLLTVRPHQDIKDSILQLGTHCLITCVCSFLTLSKFKVLDKELVSTGLMWSLLSIVVLHVIAMLAKVVSIVREILKRENEDLPVKGKPRFTHLNRMPRDVWSREPSFENSIFIGI